MSLHCDFVMSPLLGRKVRWRHLSKETGLPTIPVRGMVVAVEHSGTNSWWLLILGNDGRLVSANYDDLVVLTERGELPGPDVSLVGDLPEVRALPDSLGDLARAITELGVADETTNQDPAACATKLLRGAWEDLQKLAARVVELEGTPATDQDQGDAYERLKKENAALAAEVAELRAQSRAKAKKDKRGQKPGPEFEPAPIDPTKCTAETKPSEGEE